MVSDTASLQLVLLLYNMCVCVCVCSYENKLIISFVSKSFKCINVPHFAFSKNEKCAFVRRVIIVPFSPSGLKQKFVLFRSL